MSIVAMYADGGISQAGKAPFGAWAYCLVDEAGEYVECDYGLLLPAAHGLEYVECNAAEFYAFLRGLEALAEYAGETYAGNVCSDSQNTLNRFFGDWRCNGIPIDWIARRNALLLRFRFARLTPVLLAGHPTKAQLQEGKKGEFPVSKHNVWCDRQCGEVIRAHKADRAAVMQVS